MVLPGVLKAISTPVSLNNPCPPVLVVGGPSTGRVEQLLAHCQSRAEGTKSAFYWKVASAQPGSCAEGTGHQSLHRWEREVETEDLIDGKLNAHSNLAARSLDVWSCHFLPQAYTFLKVQEHPRKSNKCALWKEYNSSLSDLDILTRCFILPFCPTSVHLVVSKGTLTAEEEARFPVRLLNSLGRTGFWKGTRCGNEHRMGTLLCQAF